MPLEHKSRQLSGKSGTSGKIRSRKIPYDVQLFLNMASGFGKKEMAATYDLYFYGAVL